ncbi:hypothetical protein H2O64_19415 [Kordia sp. YSTF-M3]|uniref:Uncharacterized protein n=1 Tax=Kordia aestuariivivens TaxID=2759037 RepID=A0ABR7QE56_9FLAO|nr:hypothetical protein [Kordia aestuariivivens]
MSDSKIREVKDLKPEVIKRICDYMQGAVYCWCKNKEEKWFSARDLFGGENFNWSGTPMIKLFDKHKSKGKTDDSAIKGAGKDAGWILKKVLNEDKRNFETKKGDLVRKYRWIK